jgi:CBS domain-containing protein
MRISQILSGKRLDLVSVAPTSSIRTAIALMKREHVGAVVVLDADRRLLGVLSERDIVHSLDPEVPDPFQRPINQVMRRDSPVASMQDTVRSVMQTMTATRARHVPVVELGRVVGIVSIGDIVKQRMEELESERGALQDYITRG